MSGSSGNTYVSNGTPGKVYVQNFVFDDNSITPSSSVGNGNIDVVTNDGNSVNVNNINVTRDAVNNAVLMTANQDNDHIVIRSSGSGNIYLGTVNNVVRTSTLSLIGNKVYSDVVDGVIKLDPHGPNGSINIYDNLFVRNGNVGIGVGMPDTKLHVVGDVKLTGHIYNSDGSRYIMKTWSVNSNDLYYDTGNAIIGDSTVPRGKFEIVTSSDLGLIVTGDAGANIPQASFTSSTNGLYLKNNNSNSNYYSLSIEKSDSSSIFYVRNDGLIGIGTSTPSYGLEVSTSAYMSHSLVVGGTGLVVSCDDETMTLVGASSSYIGLYPDNPSVRKGYFGYKDGSIKFDTESSSRHFIFENGNLGLKTSSPVYTLTVNAGSTDAFANSSSSHGFGIIGSNSQEVMLLGYDANVGAGYLKVGNSSGAVPLLLQSNNGSVGIGTGSNSLAGKLDVRKGTAVTSGWEAASFGAETILNDLVVLGNYNGNATIAGKNATMASDANLVMQPTGGNVGIGIANPVYRLDIDGDINFTGSVYNQGNSVGLFNFFESYGNVYLSSGNLGIGNTNPTKKLDVTGDINYTGNLFKNGTLVSPGGSGLWTLYGSTNIYYTGGKVGINVIDSQETLDLFGSFQQQDSMMHFLRTMIPKTGNPQEGTHKGYIILGKAATVSGVNMPASYVIGKVIMRRGGTNEGNAIDVYDVVSSRGYDNEVFTVNFKHDGTGSSGSRFSRLVKCTYDTIEYHAIETEAAGGEPTHEQTFEGYAVDAALEFVDATYVSNVSEFGTLGYSSEISGKFGIGTFAPSSKLTVVSGTSNNQDNEQAYHGVALTTGINSETLFMGYDRTADIGYINASKSGSVQPLCLQTTGGKVGFGVENPSVGFHVNSGGLLVSNMNNNVTTAGFHMQWNRSGSDGEAWMINNVGTGADAALRNIRFGFTDAGGVVSQKMTLLENGTLGIGTSTPLTGSNLLGMHVNQGGHSCVVLGDPIGSTHGGFVQASDSKHKIFIGANIRDDPVSGWTIGETAKGYAGINVLADNGGWGTSLDFLASDSGVAAVNDDIKRMTILGNGNIGIGTTSPDATLDINGTLLLRSGTTTYNNTDVDAANLAQTYIIFGEAGSDNDWAYLRQIGSSNAYSLALDFHDDGDDVGFFIRDVKSSDTPDTIATRFCVQRGGNVGIGLSSPVYPLSFADVVGTKLSLYEDNSSLYGFGVSTSQLNYHVDTTSASHVFFAGGTNGDGNELVRIQGNGYVGIGTNSPKSKVHINGEYIETTDSLAASTNKWVSAFNVNTSWGYSANTLQSMQYSSLYATHNIITSRNFICHGTATFSDRRIKKDIVDIDDSSALETIRSIKPKKYTYIDVLQKGTETVWGFIAQEVSEVLDYAVEKMEKAIPNIYCLASVLEEGYVIELSNFDTANLLHNEDGSLMTKLLLKTWDNRELELEINNVDSSNKIRLAQPIEYEECNAVLQDTVIQDKIIVYGQFVNDFHALKKDAIFTVSVAALQEIDRRQVQDNNRIIELEGDVTVLQEEMMVTKSELSSTRDDLEMTKNELEDVKMQLQAVLSRLTTLENA